MFRTVGADSRQGVHGLVALSIFRNDHSVFAPVRAGCVM